MHWDEIVVSHLIISKMVLVPGASVTQLINWQLKPHNLISGYHDLLRQKNHVCDRSMWLAGLWHLDAKGLHHGIKGVHPADYIETPDASCNYWLYDTHTPQ